ncbi:hypothetical protein L226DRAFT_568572 [Lentinus tigrinus ALCF2SS1-7]|uniref:Uncharacterized protein n=1 Tax=Lentinus tigrinus ALCF2SS1-6 TaxID=1328759 RepID=A0A5C2SHG8_9APHY|nr:hypothetical protein L227DRAFT_609285 [Lentinus tigrinus ALCF2SS1-6]RPD77509.1 hypothetical protein L226DRAFT_568572 [Lentinus tigrinus ALCF2SS1-7]
MPSASSSTSNISVSDALANLTKAATVAFNVVQGAQEQAQEEAARLREERDDALKALQEAQLDAKDLEVREEGWKAALDKSDLTIKHQAETIAQLRAEIQQWKTQLNRLEESSRQEIDGWKEQYRRAEHERTRLSARIEELIAGQLAWNAAAHAYTAPFTPRMAYANVEEPAMSSSGTKRASTSHSHRAGTPHTGRVPADDEGGPSSTARKSRAPQSSRSVAQAESQSRNTSPTRPRRRKDNVSAVEAQVASGSRTTPRTTAASRSAPSQPQSQPRQQVIRRVTAFVDVKEEEETDDALDELDSESAASGSVYDPDEAPPIPPGGRRRRTSAKHKRAQQFDEEEQTAYEDEDEESNEAEDDELLLGPKTKKPPRAQGGGTKQSRPSVGRKQPGSTKKRKIDVDGNAASGRAGPVKAAKTR